MKINSEKVKILMAKNLLTQKALAELAGVATHTINLTLIKGQCSIMTVGKIANALKVSPEEII